MPEKVAKSYKLFQQAQRDFVNLAHRTESALKKDKDRLSLKLKRTNTRIAKGKDRLLALQRSMAEKSTEARKKQVKNIRRVLASEKKAAQELRHALIAVAEKLQQAKEQVVHARYIEKGINKIEQEIDKHLRKKKKIRKKAVKKKSIKKKAIKKKTVKKKSTSEKRHARKKSVKTKSVKKKKPASKRVKKKPAKKKDGKR